MISAVYQKGIVTIFTALLGFSQCGNKQVKTLKEPLTIIRDDTAAATRANTAPNAVPLKNMFGINAYEWNFLENPAAKNDRSHIYETNMALIKNFSAVRHYLNWNKLENTEGNYTYNPTNNGSWNYDLIYTRCKQDSILVLADLKNLPVWMMDTYPADERDDENVPTPYGANRSVPASYIVQARTAFQFAARYGFNKKIASGLVKADSRPRWNNDATNTVKIGLGLIKYIECGNENDRWWKGGKATQSPEEYAANLSAFYDGHKGTLGNNAGVKTADPGMMVVMGGLATADVKYVQRMIAWCKTNRGLKPDGSINLCFDVINYHLYSNDGSVFTHQRSTTGVAPELSISGSVADGFVKLAGGLKNKPEVWVTETGYDINPQSYQHAPAIGNKPALVTQADWILRSSLLYARHGVSRLFFYQLFDAFPNNAEQYSTSGLAESPNRRPAADYILQVKKLMGNYIYKGTINADPLVDKYQSGRNVIYVLTVPDQTGRGSEYILDVSGAKKGVIYTLKVGADAMESRQVNTVNGKLKLQAGETPIFVQPVLK
ncbi:hypothetical protein [Mucilaginibacter phyllosphaerae]|uniref:Glycoside hydrolase family 42 N-terminal domain-containing protein n=1 Tax=Mucilaginibacter phyllosphaerae TaxID=1812349 RepID=A0A4Y8ABC8_9SPHI|nr:hypothetical protein [Mucilaginibacter phyllosphaerae]MBB3969356.1 hypothetical protein [Mucilaginibacter phyllosphaerae]TEW65854.1 hypothetical protein E2R65_12010 [Mucilaginibacter phyllosphaerae]GGH07912.1 hypothetical protein GCM10007352_12860 [Mucilaginibacter phyllosphaerae]